MRIGKLSSNLGPVESFSAELCPFDLGIFHLFQFPLIISITNWHFELKFGL